MNLGLQLDIAVIWVGGEKHAILMMEQGEAEDSKDR